MPVDPQFQHLVVERLSILILLWLSLCPHEFAHAWAAWRLGDDTAALMGRLTLNPLAHIDPIGTLILPLLGVPFGWAKPVPVQPHRFTRRVSMRTGMLLTAIAGPIANLILMAIGIVVLAVLIRFYPGILLARNHAGLLLLHQFIFLNVVLAAFNMLPIPPLDGSRIADGLMPRSLRPAWESLRQLGPLALAAVIVLPQFIGISLFAWPMSAADHLLDLVVRLLGGW
jgi:Zn-dependent protease